MTAGESSEPVLRKGLHSFRKGFQHDAAEFMRIALDIVGEIITPGAKKAYPITNRWNPTDEYAAISTLKSNMKNYQKNCITDVFRVCFNIYLFTTVMYELIRVNLCHRK